MYVVTIPDEQGNQVKFKAEIVAVDGRKVKLEHVNQSGSFDWVDLSDYMQAKPTKEKS